MAKKAVKTTVKLQLAGGQATPAPPVGPALSPHGVRIGEFIKEFNDKTRDQMGVVVPVVVTVFQDNSYDLKIKSPLASVLIKEAAGLAKGSGETGKELVGEVTWKDLKKIAQRKMEDLNTKDVEAGARVIAGTARSMGIRVLGGPDLGAPDPGGPIVKHDEEAEPGTEEAQTLQNDTGASDQEGGSDA